MKLYNVSVDINVQFMSSAQLQLAQVEIETELSRREKVVSLDGPAKDQYWCERVKLLGKVAAICDFANIYHGVDMFKAKAYLDTLNDFIYLKSIEPVQLHHAAQAREFKEFLDSQPGGES